jgi:hypothetical protein
MVAVVRVTLALVISGKVSKADFTLASQLLQVIPDII